MKTVPIFMPEMISEVALIWLISLCSMGSIVAIVFGCVCGCRKKVPKNELMGLAGMVKLTNPEGNISYNSTIPVVQVDSDNATSDFGANFQDHPDPNKRPSSATATATRSLPDLPVEPGGDSVWGHNDTSSDLYATVEENKSDKRRCLVQSQSGDDGYNSPTQTDDSLSPYARVKGEHPYDQLKQSEHPYAQVHANGIPVGSNPKNNTAALPSASTEMSDENRAESPMAPPRMRKSLALSQSSLAFSEPDRGLDGCSIPAATAIAGGIPANQELPYMTPPLLNVLADTNTTQHFSGDSQDSSKGYTSISVREPLASILGERSRTQRQDLIDSHYMTVSDDSDEMYAAIEEPGQAVYTSGSETYARIRPNPLPQTRPAQASGQPSTPEDIVDRPPSQQARRSAHSRQASTSSAASSGVSPNSPKPEKRQANSPLPRVPPPPVDSLSQAVVSPTVDDMYAKVMKKRRSSQSVASLEEHAHTHTHALAPAEANYEELKPGPPAEANYAKVNKNRHKHMPVTTAEPDYASLSRNDTSHLHDHDPDYESVSASSLRDSNDPNYESLEKNDSENDPPYEKLQSTSSASLDDDYETVFRIDSNQMYSRMEERSDS